MVIALAVIALDQLTKHWAVTSLGTDREIDLFWTLRLNLAFNNGMAFGQGQGFGPVIAVIATVVIVYLLVSLQTEASTMGTMRLFVASVRTNGNSTSMACSHACALVSWPARSQLSISAPAKSSSISTGPSGVSKVPVRHTDAPGEAERPV